MARSIGVISAKFNGVQLPVLEGSTFRLGGVIREIVNVNGEPRDYHQRGQASEVTLILSASADLDEDAVRDAVDGLLEVTTDIGKTYVIGAAHCLETQEFSDQGGGWTVRYGGSAARVQA